MMKLSEQINNILEIVNSLKNELNELEKQIQIVEKKNEHLTQYLKNEDKLKSVGNLIKLYEQGFHICNDSFGRIRYEDCLFCLNILERSEINDN